MGDKMIALPPAHINILSSDPLYLLDSRATFTIRYTVTQLKSCVLLQKLAC